MPSSGLASRAVALLASTKLAIVLGFTACGLLAWASWVVPPPRSREALPFSESFAVFFDPVQARYWWFYALFAVITLYAVNAILGTARSVLRRRARGQLDQRFLGVTGLHLGLIGALFAHLFAGLSAGAELSAVLSDEPTPIAGHELALISYSPVSNPDGTLRTATARVSVDGVERNLAYNQPIFFDYFTRYLLLQGEQELPGGEPAMSVDGRLEPVRPGAVYQRPEGVVRVERLSSGAALRFPMLSVRVGDAPATWLAPGQRILPGLAYVDGAGRTGLSVVLRRNDGVPALFGAMVVFMIGLGAFALSLRRR